MYQNAKIYKIINDNIPNKVYYGSTVQPLYKRFFQHKKQFHRCTSKQLLEKDGGQIILVENVICNSKEELRKRERFYIENNECVNKHIPYREKIEIIANRAEYIKKYHIINKEKIRQYCIKNKDKISKRNKEWRKNNKDKIKETNLQYNIKNKEERQEKMKEYNLKNKELISLKSKERYLKNKEAIKLKGKEKIGCRHCKIEVRKCDFKRHCKSKRHISNL